MKNRQSILFCKDKKDRSGSLVYLSRICH